MKSPLVQGLIAAVVVAVIVGVVGYLVTGDSFLAAGAAVGSGLASFVYYKNKARRKESVNRA